MEASLLKFAETLYGDISNSQKGSFRNTCLSPYSVYTALAATLCGCEGDTKKQLLACLHLSDSPDLERNVASMLKKIVACGPGVELASANKMFLESSAHIRDSFIREVETLFESKPEKAQFKQQAESAREEINRWVLKATGDKISELFPKGSITCDTRLVLANAIFFKGAWQIPFNPSVTVDGEFHVLGGGTRPVKLMKRSGHINIEEFIVNDAMALKLPFKDPRYELLMMLPKSNEEFPAFVEAITSKGELEKVLEAPFYDQMANVMIPRFKLSMTPSVNMKKTLNNIGVTKLFQNADLGKISEEPLYVSDVVHQAVLEVNEAGAVASAATGVGVANRALLRPIEFKADHAFVVAVILDKKIPLFLGHVTVAEE